MKKVLVKHWSFLLILALSIFTAWPLSLPGFFSHHDDLQVMRVFEMRKCFSDFQIPCRWVPDMGYGNGYPLFNYYNVFPYYIGGLISYILGFIGSVKILFLVAIVLAPISMYLLAKELLGFYPALLAAVLYMFAPYRSLDIYVRGAIAEGFAIAIIPFVFYFGYKLIRKNSIKNAIGLSLSFASFLTSHTIMTVLFAPFIIALFILKLWGKNWEIVKVTFLSLGLGVGLAAFFVFPAFFEKNLVQIDNLVRFDLDFRAHFVSIYQLFLDRSWGYDSLSFQIGLPHWVLAFLSIPLVFILWRKNKGVTVTYISVLLFFIFSIFMTHNRSAFIWENIDILRFTQFPWRFLSIAIFTASLLGGFLIYALKTSFSKVLVIILVIITIGLNWSYFKPQEFYFDLTDRDKLSGKFWEIQQQASILDYLPVGAVEPREQAPSVPIIASGDAKVEYFKKASNSWESKIEVKSPAKIEIPVLDFPNWRVYENGVEFKHSNENFVGRIEIFLERGNHLITGRFTNTPIRTISNAISLFSIMITFILILYRGGHFFKEKWKN